MGAGEYEFGSIERALTAFGIMSRDNQISVSEVTLDFTPLMDENGDGFRLYETRPLTEKWNCFHAKDTPPPETVKWLRAKSAPVKISTVAILPLFGRMELLTRDTINNQPKLLYIRKSVVAAIRQAVKIHVFDRAHALAEEFIAAQSTNSG